MDKAQFEKDRRLCPLYRPNELEFRCAMPGGDLCIFTRCPGIRLALERRAADYWQGVMEQPTEEDRQEDIERLMKRAVEMLSRIKIPGERVKP